MEDGLPSLASPLKGRGALLTWPALLLIAAKCGRGFTAYTSWQFVGGQTGQMPAVVWTFLLLLAAALFYLLRKPWQGGKKRLRGKMWMRVAFNAGLYALEMTLWHACLRLYGPIRTLLVVDYGDVLLAPLFTPSSSSSSSLGRQGKRGSRVKGSLAVLLAYVLLVAFAPTTGFEDDWSLADKLGGAGLVAAAIALAFVRKRYAKKLAVQVGSAKRLTALTVIMAAAMLLPFALYAYAMHGAEEASGDGGVLINTNTDGSATASSSTSVGMWGAIVLGAVFFVAGDAWVDSIVHSRMPSPALSTKLGLGGAVMGAAVVGWMWPATAPALSLVTLLVIGLVVLGVHLRFQGETTEGGSQHPMFAEDAEEFGLPTADSSSSSSGSAPPVGGDQLWHFFKSTLKEILANGESRSIFLFLVINLAFMGVEVAYGYWTNSLGLISDGFHMLFDCTALFIGLYASVISKWKPNQMFTYGYGRVEVVSGFVNGIFLVFIALFVLFESIERFVEPPKIETDKLLLVSSLGLLVNLIGVFAFAHGHAHGGHGHSHGGDGGHGHAHKKKKKDKKKKKSKDGHKHGHSHGGHAHAHGDHDDHHHHHDDHHHDDHHHDDHDDHHDHDHEDDDHHGHHSHKKKYKHQFSASRSVLGKLAEPFADFFYRLWHEGLTDNLSGIWLHVMADTLGSVGVIFSSFCIMNWGWTIADPICSFCIAVTILLSVIPLLKQCAVTLALRAPGHLQKGIDKAVEKIKRIEGVMGVRDLHVWKLSGETVVATLHVQVQNHVDEQKIIKSVKGFFGDMVENLTVQVEKDRFYDLQTRLQNSSPLPTAISSVPSASFTPHAAPALAPHITNASRSHSVGSLSSYSGPASPPSSTSSFYSAGEPTTILVEAEEDDHHHHHGLDPHAHRHGAAFGQHIDVTVDKSL